MQEKFHILINSQSGGASALGREKIEQFINQSGLPVASFDFLEQSELDAKIIALLDSPHPILIGGGDGTITRCATLHLEKGKAFGILPFGTMNLLAQDLKIPTDFQQALHSYLSTQHIKIDVGVINDKHFLCCAAWGTMPEAARLRERSRSLPNFILLPRLASYIFKRMDFTNRKWIKLKVDGHTRTTHSGMLIISNNLYSPNQHIAPFRRRSLQGGTLGIYRVSPYGLIQKMSLFLHMKTGTWKEDSFVQEYKGQVVVVDTQSAEDLISIDGEPIKMAGPHKFTLLEKALNVIVPHSSPAMAEG